MSVSNRRKAAIDEIVRTLPRQGGQLVRLLTRHSRGVLPRGMASILGALDERAVPITQLAEREGIAQPTASRLVSRLEQRGLVTRQRSPDDNRLVIATITDEGRAELGLLRERYRTVLRSRLDRLTDRELAAILGAAAPLQGLIDALQDEASDATGSCRA